MPPVGTAILIMSMSLRGGFCFCRSSLLITGDYPIGVGKSKRRTEPVEVCPPRNDILRISAVGIYDCNSSGVKYMQEYEYEKLVTYYL